MYRMQIQIVVFLNSPLQIQPIFSHLQVTSIEFHLFLKANLFGECRRGHWPGSFYVVLLINKLQCLVIGLKQWARSHYPTFQLHPFVSNRTLNVILKRKRPWPKSGIGYTPGCGPQFVSAFFRSLQEPWACQQWECLFLMNISESSRRSVRFFFLSEHWEYLTAWGPSSSTHGRQNVNNITLENIWSTSKTRIRPEGSIDSNKSNSIVGTLNNVEIDKLLISWSPTAHLFCNLLPSP